jgi:hypothetical protein
MIFYRCAIRLPRIRVRITPRSQLDFERRTLQFESFPEESFQVTPVALGHVVERAAVNDDAWRIRSALMRVAQFRPAVPGPRRLLLFHCSLQRARELGRRELRHRSRIGRIHRFDQRADAVPFER